MAPMNSFHSVICLSFIWGRLYLLIFNCLGFFVEISVNIHQEMQDFKQYFNLGPQNMKAVNCDNSDLTLRYHNLDDLTWNLLDFVYQKSELDPYSKSILMWNQNYGNLLLRFLTGFLFSGTKLLYCLEVGHLRVDIKANFHENSPNR